MKKVEMTAVFSLNAQDPYEPTGIMYSMGGEADEDLADVLRKEFGLAAKDSNQTHKKLRVTIEEVA